MQTTSASDNVDIHLESKLKIAAAVQAAADLRLDYAKLLLGCPPSWRASVARHAVDDAIFKLGLSRKAETKTRRAPVILGDIIQLLHQMGSEAGLAKLVRTNRLDFGRQRLPKCWFVKQRGDETKMVHFAHAPPGAPASDRL